jgi:predicted membrane-bound spermidine synthase
MATRYDIVLAAIPVVAFSGVLLEAAARTAIAAMGMGGSVAELPLWIAGFLAALCLITHEILTLPVEGNS